MVNAAPPVRDLAVLHKPQHAPIRARDQRHCPPHGADHIMPQSDPEAPTADDGTQSPGRGADALRDAVDRPEHARMRRGIINQDDCSGQREGPGHDLQTQDRDQRWPDQERPIRYDCQERDCGIGHGAEGQRHAIEFQGPESGVELGVEKLEGQSDGADDSGCEAYFGGREAEATGEAKGQVCVRVVVAREGEEQQKDGIEG